MSEEQKMIIDATNNMSISQLRDVLTYIRFIQYKMENNIDEAPEHLIIKDNEDFIQKIKDGMEDSNEILFEDVIEKMDKKIEQQRGN